MIQSFFTSLIIFRRRSFIISHILQPQLSWMFVFIFKASCFFLQVVDRRIYLPDLNYQTSRQILYQISHFRQIILVSHCFPTTIKIIHHIIPLILSSISHHLPIRSNHPLAVFNHLPLTVFDHCYLMVDPMNSIIINFCSLLDPWYRSSCYH